MHDLNTGNRTASGVKGLEPLHRPRQPFHGPMILLHDIVEILAVTDDDSGVVNPIVLLNRCGVGGGFFALIKWLRNRKPDGTKPRWETQINIGDNICITNPQVVKLEKLAVREQARNLVAVLLNDGIDEISTRRGEDEKLTIKKNEAHVFDVSAMGETLENSEREMFLQIDSLSFKEGNKWRVTDGGEPFYAVIEDVDFLNKIGKSDASSSTNNNLHCLVREHQIRTSKGLLRKEPSTIRVIEHKPGMRQLKLL